jgi:hypothetical protein
MSWVEITAPTLRDRLGSVELEALVAEAPAPDAKIEELLEQISQDITSRVNSGRRKRGMNSIGDTGRYVPPGSLRHAYTLTRRLLTDSFPSLAEYNGEDRRMDVEEAESHLDDLANNNADSDDPGASTWEPSGAGSSFRTGGETNQNFSVF